VSINQMPFNSQIARAEALMGQADTLARTLRLREALEALEQAAQLWRTSGAAAEHRRCSLLAAETARLAGQPERSRRHAIAALEGADAGTEAQVHALLAAADMAQGDAAGAEEQFSFAISLLPGAAAPAWWQARAQARMSLGRFGDAALDLEEASRRCIEVGDPASGRSAAVHAACAWHAAGRRDEAGRILAEIEASAQAARDDHALGAAEVLRATLSIEAGDPCEARTHLLSARKHALASRSVDTYIAAASALALLADRLGEHAQAYAALATGWATLADLTGPDLARSTFEPQLKALLQQWGTLRFAAIKQQYERQPRNG